MMDEKAFLELVREIQSQGYDQATAAHYAMLIGDTPIQGADGKLVVMESGRVVARLDWLTFFSSE